MVVVAFSCGATTYSRDDGSTVAFVVSGAGVTGVGGNRSKGSAVDVSANADESRPESKRAARLPPVACDREGLVGSGARLATVTFGAVRFASAGAVDAVLATGVGSGASAFACVGADGAVLVVFPPSKPNQIAAPRLAAQTMTAAGISH